MAESEVWVERARRQGQATVALYRRWWEAYDRRTQGLQVEGEAEHASSSYLAVWLGLVLLALCLLVVVMVATTCRRRRRAVVERSPSRLSLPPPYEVVVEEKARLAGTHGLPSYREACPLPPP